VLDHLPKEDRAQAKAVLRAAWKLEPKEGIKRVKKLAAWLDERYPSAAASLLEGLEECFTINRLGLPPSLMRCLATTNVIESPHAGVRIRTRRVTHWQDGKMVLRWMASAFLQTEKHFRKVMGHRELWILKAALHDDAQPATIQVAA
jgi:transposase-like protein